MPAPEQSDRSLDQYKLWLDQLSSEYSILQDKIDKIGAFRFTIRGWSVTLVIASVFGVITAKVSTCYILGGLLTVVVAFLTMERAQTRHSHTFTHRVAVLEKRIWHMLRACSAPQVDGPMVPKIAHDIEDDSKSRWPLEVWLDNNGYWLFYGLQIVLIVIAGIWLGENRLASDDRGATTVNVISAPESPAIETKGTPDKALPFIRKHGKKQ
jgi:hypothetical protein